jgi:hypothetical protein
MNHPLLFPNIKFGIRSATAFVAHSFAKEDEEIVDELCDFFTKLGMICDSGRRAEPIGISAKVKKRIKEAEVFIGIFTRDTAKRDGTFTTRPWLIEEKTFALTEGKKILMFVEEGVKDIGGMQEDLEYIEFNRTNFGGALIRAVDYILAVTSIPLQTQVMGNNINISIGDNSTPAERLSRLRQARERNRKDSGIVIAIANLLESMGKPEEALKEMTQARGTMTYDPELTHQIGHLLERQGDLDTAIKEYRVSLNLNPSHGKYFFCLGKSLYMKAMSIDKAAQRRELLEKAQNYLEQASKSADPAYAQQVPHYLFLINQNLDAGTPPKRQSKN